MYIYSPGDKNCGTSGLGLGQDISFCFMEAVFCQLHETLLYSPTSMNKLHGFAKHGKKTCHSFTATNFLTFANLPNPFGF